MHLHYSLPALGLAALASSAAVPKCARDATAYDFIIVGGGTAGLAVASGLSLARPSDCILVIEAGPAAYDEPGINIPGRKGSTLGGKYDWNFTTVAQPNANNRSFSVNRGKVLGGSSALNLMTWDRGAVADYDAWEQLGNPGWNWKNFIKAMVAIETFQRDPRYSNASDAGVGYAGPIQTLINRVIPPQQLGFIPALESFGLPNNLASLDGNPIGVMYQPSNIRASNYTRSYSPTFLNFAGPNLAVMTNTTVSKINTVLCSTTGLYNATGVLLPSGQIFTAKKEVILTAGSIQSPQLLELSGIGNKTILAAAGINSVVDLPSVGENLQDHLRIQNSYQLKPKYPSFDDLRLNASYVAEQLALYNANKVSEYDYTGSGYAYTTWDQVNKTTSKTLTALALASAEKGNVVDAKKVQYLTTSLNASVPQYEVIFSDGYTGAAGYPAVNTTRYGQRFFTLIAVIQHPFARGSIHINATNPSGKPVINPKYLSKPYDLAAVIAATKFNRQIAQSPALRDYWIDEYEPGLNTTNTDAEWEAFARRTTLSIYHPMGTCAMLPRKDGGVVSSEGIVYGTGNLRVFDASVIPVQPSGHLQTMVYGIAVQGVVRIAESWKGR
ncbi:hypothetical protein LTR95_000599 [Oleoguttula sp. CCFEE 5521]